MHAGKNMRVNSFSGFLHELVIKCDLEFNKVTNLNKPILSML